MAIRSAVCRDRNAGGGDRRSAGDLSPADVPEIIATEGITGGGSIDSYPTDQSIRPTLTPIAQLASAPTDENHLTYAPAVPPPIARSDQRTWDVARSRGRSLSNRSPPTACPPMSGVFASPVTAKWCARFARTRAAGKGGRRRERHAHQLGQQYQPHNIDFHVVTGQGGGGSPSPSTRGHRRRFSSGCCTGVFMYHCAYGGAFRRTSPTVCTGMFIVDPETPLPAADHEWAMAQSGVVREPNPTPPDSPCSTLQRCVSRNPVT